MHGICFDYELKEWFDFKIPNTTIPSDYIVSCLEKEENFAEGDSYLNTFTNDPAIWKQASPIYFLHNGMPPMLIYRGGKTYPSIINSNEKFTDSLKAYDTKFNYQIQPGKKHVPMIIQFFNPYNKRYKEIVSFMKEK